MPPEDEEISDVVRDSPRESDGDSNVASLARDGQTKTDDQQRQEKEHALKRQNYETNSSEVLPKLDFELDDLGGVVAKVQVSDLVKEAINISVSKESRESPGTQRPENGGNQEKVERKADGSEGLQAKDGSDAKSNTDKLLEKFNYTSQEQRQLRQDLSVIDQLPPEQKEKVYKSLEQIAKNGGQPEGQMGLTGQQAGELVSSLAHQIANPEVIAAAERTLVRTHPDVYADLVSKLATDGQYTNPEGTVVHAHGFNPEQFAAVMKGDNQGLKKALEDAAAGNGSDKRGDKAAQPKLDGPKEKVDEEKVKKALEDFEDGESWIGDDDFDKMNKALAGKSPQELKAMDEQFKKDHDGQSIADYLRDRWKDNPDQLKKALDTLQAGKGPADEASVKQAAEQIDDALDTFSGDDYEEVHSALQNRSPEELKAINEAFKKEHDGKGIEEVLKERWKDNPEELKKALELLHPGEKGSGDKKSGESKPGPTPEGKPGEGRDKDAGGDAKGGQPKPREKPESPKEGGDAKPSADQPATFGKRHFIVRDDGTAEYTVKQGDTLGAIARDALKQKHPGRQPTDREIVDEANRIAKDSGIKDPNKIFPGEKLVIKSLEKPREKPPADKPPADKPPADKPPADKPPADKPSDKPAAPSESPVPSEPTRTENFYPKDGAYNPIASPGIGDSPAGEAWEDERDMGGDNTDIDWRESEKEVAKDGTVTYRYKGELDGAVTDTNFTGSEKWKDGRLLERHASYEGGEDITFKTPDGNTKEIEGVTNVDTTYNPKTGNYDTVITAEDGKKYRAETAPDGTVKSFKEATEKFGEPKPADAPSDKSTDKPSDKPAKLTDDQKKTCEAAADAIEDACNGGIGVGTNKEKILAILKDKTEAERAEIDRVFREKYGKNYGDKGDGSDWGLEDEFRDEMEGADLEQCLNALNRRDGDTDRAGRIHQALTERGQLVEGRDDEMCEKDIRETLATMNSDQIEQLKKDYQARYGKSLEDALLDNPDLSDATKKAAKILLNGTDKRTDNDTLELAKIALEAEDVEMFKETMSKASPAAREKFLAEGGQKKIEDAFWGADEDHALEYAKRGELSTVQQLKDNQSWAGDNEKAIEKSLSNMSKEEREAYKNGRDLANGKEVPGLNEEQKAKALETYKTVREQLEDAGNETEVARWEDMITTKDGSLVSKLAAHRGSVYDDGMDDVTNTIENMSEKDWKRLNKDSKEYDPKFREEIEKTLKTYVDDPKELERLMALVDKKAEAKTFDEAGGARRPILDAIGDASGTFDDNEKNIHNAIKNMSPEERQKYKDDPEFRKQVDDKIKDVLDDGPEQEAAFRMLKQIEKGEKPTEDIVTKLLEHAGGASKDTDEAAVVRDVLKEFRDHPEVRDRILNPKTPEDHEFKKNFEEALRKSLGSSDFEKYGKPLLETGRIPIDLQLELSKGWTDDDEQGAYKDITELASLAGKYPKTEEEAVKQAHADAQAKGKKEADPEVVEAAKARAKDDAKRFEEALAKGDPDAKAIKAAKEERDAILKDPDSKLAFLSEDERQIAKYALEQGEMKPEDKIRSHMVGAGTGEEEIKEVLKGLSPAEKERVKSEYAKKYGSDLTGDMLEELGGQDATDAKRAIAREPKSAEEAFDRARDEYYESRSGFGSEWTDAMWDGTGSQADQAYLKFSKAMAESSAKFEELPPEKQKELLDNLQQQLDMFRESKMAVADGLTDAAIAAGCLGLAVGGVFTKGGTWVVLGALIAGGALKMGGKGLIMGADYDWSSSGALVDFASGGADAALNFVTLGAGGSALKSILKAGGKELIKEGTEAALEQGLKQIVKESLENGAKKGAAEFSEKSIKELVEKLAKDGADKAALEKMIREGLDKGVQEVSEGMIKQMAINAAEGSIGGAGSGGVRAAAEWDTNKSFAENMAKVGQMVAQAAAFGAGGSAGASVVFKVGGKAYNAIKDQVKTPEGLKALEKQIEKESGKDVDIKVEKNGDVKVTPKPDAPSAGDRPAILPPEPKRGVGEPGYSDTGYTDGAGNRIVYKANAPDSVPGKGPIEIDPKNPPKGMQEIKIGNEAAYRDADGNVYRQLRLDNGTLKEGTYFPDGKYKVEARPKGSGTDSVPPSERPTTPDTPRDRPTRPEGPSERPTRPVDPSDRPTPPVEPSDRPTPEIRPSERPTAPGEPSAVRERVPNEELVKNTPEVNHLTDAEKAALLKRMANDPMFKPEAVNDYTDNVSKLMSSPEFKSLPPEQRLAELQKAMDAFADRHGLPHSKLELLPPDAGEGIAGGYGDGKIALKEADLADPSKLLERLYHETAHAQQDSLVIRKLADELKIDKNATPEQVEALKKLYKERTNGELSNDDFLKDVLKQRDGKSLDADQLARAEAAEKAFKDDPFRSGKMEKLDSEFKEVNSEMQKFFKRSEHPNASEDLVKRMSEDPELARRLFGGEPPDNVKQLIEKHKSGQVGDKFPKEEADKILQSELGKRNNQLLEDINKGLEEYRKNGNEAEAHLIGRKAQMNGDAQAKPERVSIDGTDHDVIARDGDTVAVRKAGPPGEVQGSGIPEGEYDLAEYKSIKVGDETYYRGEDGSYYRLNSKKELVEDFDIEFVPRERLSTSSK